MTDKSKNDDVVPARDTDPAAPPSPQEVEAANMRALEIFVNAGKILFLDAQKAAGDQEMQMARLRIDFAKGFVNKFFWFVMTVIAIAVLFVVMGDGDLGAQIIFAVLGFVGGTGFGMCLRK